MNALPDWLTSQLQDRNRATSNLNRAADQINTCMAIADGLHAQGREHHTDPTWQAAATESHRLHDIAAADGHDEYTVAAEATRRRGTQ